MNRKLVNAMLLVALATGSCSMFTSCKDTDDDFYSTVISNEAQLEKEINQAKQDIATIKANFDNYYTKQQVDDKLTPIQQQLKDLQDQIDNLPGQPDLSDYATKEELKVIQNKLKAYDQLYKVYFKAFDDRLNGLVTDVTVHQAWNPMFGSINLPIGLNTTATTNYYGQSDKAFQFPGDVTREVIRDANGENAGIAAIKALTPPTFSVPAGIYMNENTDKKGSLGYLYLGINPTSIDPDSIHFSLTTSDNQIVFDDIKLTPSDKRLMFGVSRAVSENGFYQSEITIDPTKATDYKINIESGLTEAMKNALQNPTKSDFATLGKIVYDQMKDITPAYAVKAEWQTPHTAIAADWTPEFDAQGNLTKLPKVEMDTVSYVGKYEIAAATLKPLGFMFLEGVGASSDKLPTIGSLEEVINKVFQDIKININADNIKVDGQDITIYVNDEKVVLTYNPSTNQIEGSNDGALNKFIDSVNAALQGAVGQINDSVEESIENIKNSLIGKASKFDGLVDRYNSLATRINNFLKNPNHYLQVAMAYEGKDGQLHHLSANKNFPSVFTKGTGAYQLYLTSYTGEIVAPACKKYVAVVNGPAKDAINGTTHFNTILPGNQHAVTLDASKLQPGDYEVVYSALDYRGYTSTRTFYFTVK